MSTGTRQLAKARKLLSDAQLLAFLAAETASTTAHTIAREELRKGIGLDAFFKEYDAPGSSELHIRLQVVRLGPRTFRITFGFEGPYVGDGCEWRVVFTARGAVQRMEEGVSWTS